MTLSDFLQNNDFSFFNNEDYLKEYFTDNHENFKNFNRLENAIINKTKIIKFIEMLKHLPKSEKINKIVIYDQLHFPNVHGMKVYPNGNYKQGFNSSDYNYSELINMELDINYFYIDEKDGLVNYTISLIEYLTNDYTTFTDEDLKRRKKVYKMENEVKNNFNNLKQLKPFKNISNYGIFYSWLMIPSAMIIWQVNKGNSLELSILASIMFCTSILCIIFILLSKKRFKSNKLFFLNELFKNDEEAILILSDLKECEFEILDDNIYLDTWNFITY